MTDFDIGVVPQTITLVQVDDYRSALYANGVLISDDLGQYPDQLIETLCDYLEIGFESRYYEATDDIDEILPDGRTYVEELL